MTSYVRSARVRSCARSIAWQKRRCHSQISGPIHGNNNLQAGISTLHSSLASTSTSSRSSTKTTHHATPLSVFFYNTRRFSFSAACARTGWNDLSLSRPRPGERGRARGVTHSKPTCALRPPRTSSALARHHPFVHGTNAAGRAGAGGKRLPDRGAQRGGTGSELICSRSSSRSLRIANRRRAQLARARPRGRCYMLPAFVPPPVPPPLSAVAMIGGAPVTAVWARLGGWES